MGENNTTDIVISNLKTIGINYEDLKADTKNWLENIEQVIQDKLKEINNCLTTLKDVSFDISAIAKDLHTSRQNLYSSRKGILKQYIEISTKDVPLTPFQQIDKFREDKSNLQEEIELLMIKDVKNELLLKQVDELKLALKTANERNYSNTETIMKLENEIMELKKKQTHSGNNEPIIY